MGYPGVYYTPKYQLPLRRRTSLAHRLTPRKKVMPSLFVKFKLPFGAGEQAIRHVGRNLAKPRREKRK
eukprot:6193328-Pleurochrysis_carterae.AAC.1